jgi:hypothetical protein
METPPRSSIWSSGLWAVAAAVAMVVVVAQGNVAEDKATDRGPFKSIVDTTSSDEQAEVEALLTESYSVLRSPEFRTNLLALGVLYPVIYARPDKQDADVAEVARVVGVEPLGARYAPVVVQVVGRNDRRDPMGIHASAGEGFGLGRYSEMALGRYFLDQFRSADLVERSCALNAAAHEYAHTITLTPVGFRNAFTDTRVDEPQIQDRQYPGTPIASYLIGAVAQCTWLQSKGRIDSSGLAACVEVFGVSAFSGRRCALFKNGEAVALRPGLPPMPPPL